MMEDRQTGVTSTTTENTFAFARLLRNNNSLDEEVIDLTIDEDMIKVKFRKSERQFPSVTFTPIISSQEESSDHDYIFISDDDAGDESEDKDESEGQEGSEISEEDAGDVQEMF